MLYTNIWSVIFSFNVGPRSEGFATVWLSVPLLFGPSCVACVPAGCIYSNEVQYELPDAVFFFCTERSPSVFLMSCRALGAFNRLQCCGGRCVETEPLYRTPLPRVFNDLSSLCVCVCGKAKKKKGPNAHYELLTILFFYTRDA